jgi:hypothetical protein
MFLAIAGCNILLAGIGTLPGESDVPSMNPETNQIYTIEERKELYKQSVLDSVPFKCIITGSALLISSGILGLGLYRYSLRKTQLSQIVPFREYPEVVQALTPTESDLEPIDPLPKHSASTTHELQPIELTTRRVTWNELKQARLEGQTTSI